MKTSHYTSLFAFVLACLFAFALSSCSREDFPPINSENNDRGYIIATLNTQTRDALAENVGDKILHTVRIFVFVGDDLETQQIFRRSHPNEWYNPFRLEVAIGKKNVLVVANETAYMTPALEAAQTIEELYSIKTEHRASFFEFIPTQGLPMTGREDDVHVTIGGEKTTIVLTKLVAKLNITIIDGSKCGNIQINSITLFNNKGSSLLWGRSDDAFLSASESDFFDKHITVSKTNDRWIVPTLYLYENLHGQNNRDKATRLEIKAILRLDSGNGIDFNDFPVIYSVYINEQLSNVSAVDSPEKSHFLIQRGHHYRLTGTIWGTEYTHITVKMNVEAWQEGNSPPQRPLPPLLPPTG